MSYRVTKTEDGKFRVHSPKENGQAIFADYETSRDVCWIRNCQRAASNFNPRPCDSRIET